MTKEKAEEYLNVYRYYGVESLTEEVKVDGECDQYLNYMLKEYNRINDEIASYLLSFCGEEE